MWAAGWRRPSSDAARPRRRNDRSAIRRCERSHRPFTHRPSDRTDVADVRGGPGGGFDGPLPEERYACWIALSLKGFGPTGRTNVQYSSNFTGSLELPSSTRLPLSSVV